MSLANDCGACMVGNHDQHDPDHGITDGLIGGAYCACGGDCSMRAAGAGEALRDLLTRPGVRGGDDA